MEASFESTSIFLTNIFKFSTAKVEESRILLRKDDKDEEPWFDFSSFTIL